MSHTTRAVAALAATELLLVPAAESHAAAVNVDHPCYADPSTQRMDRVQLAGSGFAPSAPYEVSLDGQPVPGAGGQTDASGALSGAIAAPSVAPAKGQQTFTLAVQDGAATSTTTFSVSRLLADFRPHAGDPARMKVRFSLYGFALQGQHRPRVYLHYLDPRGRLRRTVRLGVAHGACGRLRTRPRRLFGFRARPGTWRLQFDTSRRFRPGTAASDFLFYALGVRVSRDRR